MSQSDFHLRPSKAATWVQCPGSVKLSEPGQDTYDEEDDEVREEGTACHWLAHQRALGINHPVGSMAPNNIAITDEMHEACDVYFDAIRGWGVPSAFFEYTVRCPRIHAMCGGTMDVGAWNPQTRTIYIGDLKFGYRFVDVWENVQLICYYTGLEAALGLESDLDTWVEFLIVQPRSYHKDGPVHRWRVRAYELRALVNILHMAAEDALSDSPKCKVNPGCMRCEGRVRCETARQAGLAVTNASFDAMPHNLPFAAAEQELRVLRASRDIVDARITALEQQVAHGIKSGQSSRFFELTQPMGRKVWKEGSEAQIHNLSMLYGIPLTKETLITPTQAEKKIPPSIVAALSHRQPGALKLTPFDGSKMLRKFNSKEI